jgi:hypothetical protein
MNGRPPLSELAQLLQEHDLEAILIGNARFCGVFRNRKSTSALVTGTPFKTAATQRVELDGHTLLVSDPRDLAGSTQQASSGCAQREQIRRWLRLPPDQRTHFLRERIGIQASCL